MKGATIIDNVTASASELSGCLKSWKAELFFSPNSVC